MATSARARQRRCCCDYGEGAWRGYGDEGTQLFVLVRDSRATVIPPRPPQP